LKKQLGVAAGQFEHWFAVEIRYSTRLRVRPPALTRGRTARISARPQPSRGKWLGRRSCCHSQWPLPLVCTHQLKRMVPRFG